MRNLVILLALTAWIASCFDAVSYMRATDNERVARVAEHTADGALAARETEADADNDVIRRKVEKDQLAVDTDEVMLQHAQNNTANTLRENHILNAEKATLAADRLIEFDSEDLARAAPDPEVTAARDSVQVYQRAAAEAQAVQARDAKLGRPLIVLWLSVVVLGFWTSRNHTGVSLLRMDPHTR
jgi:hypothetical protein